MALKKLHILFLTSWYPSRVQPTIGDFIHRHAQAISSFHKISLIHVITDPLLKEKVEYEIKNENNLYTYIAYIPSNISWIKKLLYYQRSYFHFFKIIGSFDLIHVNKLFPSGIVALYFKLFKNKKYLISEHWTGYHFPNNQKIGYFEKFTSKIITQYASFVCPVTQNLSSSMLEFGLKGNYFPIPNVVDTDLFIPKECQNEKLNFIHISSLLDEHKNVSGIIRVLAEFNKSNQNYICYFIGGKIDNYLDLINQQKLTENQLVFIDHIPQNEMVNYLQKANLLLLFSNHENLPCVILEAFSCGVPVLSTNVGGISEYFPENFGRLIEPKNEYEMLEKLLEFQQTKWETKEKMHAYANENFGKEIIVQSFNNLYFKML